MSYETLVKNTTALFKKVDDRLAVLKAFHEELLKAVAGTSTTSRSKADQFAEQIARLQMARNECGIELGNLRQHHHNYIEELPSGMSMFEKTKAIASGIGGSIAHPVKFTKTVAMKIEQSASLNEQYDEIKTKLEKSVEKLNSEFAKSPSDDVLADLHNDYLSRNRSGTISPPT